MEVKYYSFNIIFILFNVTRRNCTLEFDFCSTYMFVDIRIKSIEKQLVPKYFLMIKYLCLVNRITKNVDYLHWF